VPVIRATVRSWCAGRPGLARADVVAVARALWSRPVHDCRMASVELLDANAGLLRAGDVPLLETMLRTARTWALVDSLAGRVMGQLAERYPDLGSTLDRWAADDDFWLRRSAMLALLGPLRHGDGDFARFSRYADSMLAEKEFFIRKAIGWILRDTGKRRPALVAAWLAPRVHRASGVTMREAVKPLPPEIREQLMAGCRARRPVILADWPPRRPPRRPDRARCRPSGWPPRRPPRRPPAEAAGPRARRERPGPPPG
jgi:3-methyladenine DNA glycosylase AlkD